MGGPADAYFWLTFDRQGGGGVQNLQIGNYVICECSLITLTLIVKVLVPRRSYKVWSAISRFRGICASSTLILSDSGVWALWKCQKQSLRTISPLISACYDCQIVSAPSKLNIASLDRLSIYHCYISVWLTLGPFGSHHTSKCEPEGSENSTDDKNPSDLDRYGIRWLRAQFLNKFVMNLWTSPGYPNWVP